jgi:hypothetical protein
VIPLTALLFLAQQQPPELPDWINGVIQAAVILIFLILPGLKALLERKRREGTRGPAAPTQRRRAEIERDGGDLWREILRGERKAPPAPPAPPPRPAQRPQRTQLPAPPLVVLPPSRPPSMEADPDLERPQTRIEPDAAEALRELHRQRMAEAERRRAMAAELERAQAERPVERGRAAAQQLGGLDARVEGTPVGRLETGVAPASVADPATLDDELGRRWGEGTQVGRPSEARAALLSGAGDLRRAVLLAEVLAPPIALRGSAAAWPGPPASLAS